MLGPTNRTTGPAVNGRRRSLTAHGQRRDNRWTDAERREPRASGRAACRRRTRRDGKATGDASDSLARPSPCQQWRIAARRPRRVCGSAGQHVIGRRRRRRRRRLRSRSPFETPGNGGCVSGAVVFQPRSRRSDAGRFAFVDGTKTCLQTNGRRDDDGAVSTRRSVPCGVIISTARVIAPRYQWYTRIQTRARAHRVVVGRDMRRRRAAGTDVRTTTLMARSRFSSTTGGGVPGCRSDDVLGRWWRSAAVRRCNIVGTGRVRFRRRHADACVVFFGSSSLLQIFSKRVR